MELQPLLRIASERLGVVFPPDAWVDFPLYARKNPDSFQQFLINDRIRPFLQLKILWQFCNESEFLVGHGQTKELAFNDDDEMTSEHEFGPSLCAIRCSDEQLFDMLLYRLGFTMLFLREGPRMTRLLTLRGEHKPRGEFQLHDEAFILVKPEPNLIITETRVHVLKGTRMEKEMRSLLAYHAAFFDDFLTEHPSKKTGVIPHEVYVDWLMTWFPGRIRLKSLGYQRYV
ncbi:MAG: hypothetical protein AABY13_05985 [Nanoarchaeota archaeon]